MIEKRLSYGWQNSSLYPFRFGCYEGELRPGLSGWMKEKAEVLELLAFWKPEQQAAHRFQIWRPLGILPPFFNSKRLVEDK